MAKRTIPKQFPNAPTTYAPTNAPAIGAVKVGQASLPKTRVKSVTHSTRTRKR